MIYTIEEIKKKTIPFADEYNLGKISLFSSYDRGEASEDSDIDLLIDTMGLMGIVKYSSLLNKLEKEFKCHVDLVTMGCSNEMFLK